MVVGKPIKVHKVEFPDYEQIEELHAVYVDALKNLYNEYNPKYGDVNVSLVIK